MSDVNPTLPPAPPTHLRRLANGMTLVVREIHSAPVVAIVTYVSVGYFDEADEVVGISHVLEHMFFKGTERRGVGAIARETKAAGGYLNAGTIYDHTSYYTVLPSAALELGLDVQADALRNSLIDPDELRRELEVIVQEAKRKQDTPSAVAAESLYETMFDVHRMRRWRIGREEGLRKLTRDDVWGFYRREYQPSRIVLVVAGDVHPERTFELIEQLYADMADAAPPRERGPDEPPRRDFRLRELTGDILEAYLEIGWHTPGMLHEDAHALDLLAVVLGQGRASRLYRGVRERGLVTGIGADNYTPTELGVFNIGAELVPDDAPAAIEAIFAEVAALRAAPVSGSELQRARNILEARVLRRLETAEGQANLLAEWQALGDWRLAERYLERVLAATSADLQRVAARYLTADAATTLLYRPRDSQALPWDAAALADRLRAAAPAPPPPATNTEVVVPPVARRARARSSEDGVHFFDVAEGVRLAVKPRSAAPLVSIAIATRGGVLDESQAEAGLTGLMARVSLKGTTTRSGAQLAEMTESLGGSISPSVSSDMLLWSLSLPARHFARGFELLADTATNPAFPVAELETERKVTLSDLAQLRDDMYRFPMQLFFQTAYPDHPYGHGHAQLEHAVRSHTRDRLSGWHASLLGRERWIFAVGDVDPEEAAGIIAGRIDGAGSGVDRGTAPARPEWPREAQRAVEMRDKAQTALVLGFPAPDRGHEDVYALQVLANAVSGLGGRLFDELREKLSLAYTVAAYPIARWQAGAFVAYIATSPEREEEARAALLSEFARMRTIGVAADDVERSRRYTVGTWQIRSQSNGAQLSDLAAAVMLGKGLEELREFESRILAVTPARVREVAERYFDPTRLVEGIVRGATRPM